MELLVSMYVFKYHAFLRYIYTCLSYITEEYIISASRTMSYINKDHMYIYITKKPKGVPCTFMPASHEGMNIKHVCSLVPTLEIVL